jgi:O-acetylserine/cysteine efflux transporter
MLGRAAPQRFFGPERWSQSGKAALLVLLLVNLVWGGSMPATKLGLAEFTPFVLGWSRLCVSAALFFAVLLIRGQFAGLRARDWRDLLALGVLGYSGTIGLQTLGASGTSGANAVVLGSTGPLWIALCASAFLGERFRWMVATGLVIALAGVALVMGFDPGDSQAAFTQHLGGNLLMLASTICFGLFTVLGKSIMQRHSPLVVSGITCLGGAAGLLPLALTEIAITTPQPSAAGIGIILYLGVVVTFAGMLAWFWAIRLVPASRGGASLFLQPVSGVAIAALLLGDMLSGSFLTGTAFVLAGLYLVARK